MHDSGAPPRRPRPGYSHAQHSGAGWSESPTQGHAGERLPPSASSAQLQVGDEDRYEEEYTLGQGGMGVVQAVLDHRLGRRLALKRTRQPDALLEARLRREIRILANLQHPGIVQLLEAGADAQGRPWYTMPKLPGRTLEEELADKHTRAQRSALLRPMLAVCQAVAHAHERGFVHRDLKPANVIVGGRGQTFVLDWGLARWVDEPEDAPIDLLEASPVATNKELTAYGQVLGTPRYMSPEQGRGELADRPSDVYALGAMLYAVAFGRALPECDGPLPESAFTSDDPPAAAFVAIVRKCLAYDPVQRYADAGELAQEIERFLDGRRVEAHAYSPSELFGRFVAEHRVSIGVGLLGVLAITILGGLSYLQIRDESQRARKAEQRAREALVRSEASQAQTREALALSDRRLHDALVSQAQAAQRVGADPEAERFALEALAVAPSPEARGVLSAVTGQGVAKVEYGPEVPECERAEFFPHNGELMCLRQRRVTLVSMEREGMSTPRRVSVGKFHILDPEHFLVSQNDGISTVHPRSDFSELHRLQRNSLGIAIATRARAGQLIHGLHGDWNLSWTEAGGLQIDPGSVIGRICGERGAPQDLVRRHDDDPHLWGLCASGELFRLDGRDEDTRVVAHAEAPKVISRIAVGHGLSSDILFVAGHPGELHYHDPITFERTRSISLKLGRIQSIVVDPRGERVALRDDFGRVEVREILEPERRLRLPGHDAMTVEFDSEGRLMVGRDRLERWTLPEELPVRRLLNDAGFSSVTLSHDRAWIAASDGSGTVSLWAEGEGQPRWRHRWQRGVAKDCAFAATDNRLACTTMQGGPRIWHLPEADAIVPEGTKHVSHRRVAWLGDELWMLAYTMLPARWLGPGETSQLPGGEGDWKDLGQSPDGRSLIRLDDLTGRLREDEIDAEGKLESYDRIKRPGAVAVDLGPNDELAVVGPGALIELLDADNQSLFKLDTSLANRLLDVEISADGELIAAASLRGEILIWNRRGELLARLQGHEQRVVKLVFAPDSSYLLSASWDQSIRRWELTALGSPLGSIPDPQWQLSLDEAMRSPGI